MPWSAHVKKKKRKDLEMSDLVWKDEFVIGKVINPVNLNFI